MDIEKLIEKLQNAAGGPEGIKMCHDAATTISALQAENVQLRVELEYEQEHANAYHEECEQWEIENEKLRAEFERVKKVMRDNGIMVIPSKYPSGWPEWNIPKPCGQKED